MRIFSTEQSVGIKVGSLPTILKKNYADKNVCVRIYTIMDMQDRMEEICV